jgi:hypothetical protein
VVTKRNIRFVSPNSVVGIDSKLADGRDLSVRVRTAPWVVPARTTLHARARAEVAREAWSVRLLTNPFASLCRRSRQLLWWNGYVANIADRPLMAGAADEFILY